MPPKLDFISVSSSSQENLQHVLDVAKKLKKQHKATGHNDPLAQGKVLACIFEKPSLRTRVSFEIAMAHLGGHSLYISPHEIGLGTRESVPDVARVLSGMADGIMARVFEHQKIKDLAANATVPVINGLSDYSHPCQAMADVLTMIECKGRLKGLNVTYVGDGNNVVVSLLHLCAKLGANFTLATPAGYDLNPQAAALGREFAVDSGSAILFVRRRLVLSHRDRRVVAGAPFGP